MTGEKKKKFCIRTAELSEIVSGYCYCSKYSHGQSKKFYGMSSWFPLMVKIYEGTVDERKHLPLRKRSRVLLSQETIFLWWKMTIAI